MKIRLALVDEDQKYASRLLNYYSNNYSDKLELSYFTSYSIFKENLLSKNIDAVLISENCKADLNEIKDKMLVAYFTESLSIDSIHNVKAICKYQKPDLIYKEILRLFSEYESDSISYKLGDTNKTTVEIFMPVSGGAGATSIAVAYARKLADKGLRTLYLNLEYLQTTDYFFEGEGTGSFQDVIYAIKSRKPNLALKLESLVRQDGTGVYFFSSAPNALDMQEFRDDDISQFISELQAIGNYERIVIDTDLNMGDRMKMYGKYAYRFILVAEQSDVGMKKLEQMSKAILLLEGSKQIDVSTKLTIMCNKSSQQKKVSYSGEIPIKEFIPICNGTDQKQIVEQLVRCPILEGNRRI